MSESVYMRAESISRPMFTRGEDCFGASELGERAAVDWCCFGVLGPFRPSQD